MAVIRFTVLIECCRLALGYESAQFTVHAVAVSCNMLQLPAANMRVMAGLYVSM